MPLFSIVIPCLNAAATLPETLASLRSQTFKDWEAIVIDDGSNDDTHRLVTDAAHHGTRITLRRNPGKGPSDARNFGAMHCAKGSIIAFCDADDIWHPDKLADVAEAAEDTGISALYGKIAFFQNDISAIRTTSTVPSGAATVPMLMGENPVCTTSNLCIRREVFTDLGGFNSAMVHNEDLEFLIRLVAMGYILKGLEALHVYYRTSASGLSADLTAMQQGRERALATAHAFGFAPEPEMEAIYLRYLARRALRLNVEPRIARRFALQGLARSASAFLNPPRRGVATALAAVSAPFLPSALRRALFTH